MKPSFLSNNRKLTLMHATTKYMIGGYSDKRTIFVVAFLPALEFRIVDL